MKMLKIKSTLPQRIGKILLWVLVVFLLLRGIGSVFKQSDSMTAREVVEQYTQENEQKRKQELEAAAFAQGFVSEYLTYDNTKSMEDYSGRLKKYVAGYVELPQAFTGDASSVQDTEVTGIKWFSGTQLNVDVRAKVRYTKKGGPETVSSCTLRVPVAILDGLYSVEEVPAFVPDQDKAAIKLKPYTGKEMDADQAKEIRTMLENFFKTYYSGTSGEIAYYMADTKTQVKGMEKRFELQKLDSANIYTDEKNQSIVAIVALSVKDSVNGQVLPQKFNVSIVKKENRFYIKNFDVRAGNIN